MLGGYGGISAVDLRSSTRFINDLIENYGLIPERALGKWCKHTIQNNQNQCRLWCRDWSHLERNLDKNI